MASIVLYPWQSARIKVRLKYKKADVVMLPANFYKKVRLHHVGLLSIQTEIKPTEIEVTQDDQEVEFIFSLFRVYQPAELKLELVYFSPHSPSGEGGHHFLGTITCKKEES
jgi:hypothetical protein